MRRWVLAESARVGSGSGLLQSRQRCVGGGGDVHVEDEDCDGVGDGGGRGAGGVCAGACGAAARACGGEGGGADGADGGDRYVDGRITCRLYDKQAPVTVANFVGLAEGTKDWKDPATDQMVHGKPFYDGTGLAGTSDGILGGDRLGRLLGTAGPPFPMEKSGLGFERAGRLVMAKYKPRPGEAASGGEGAGADEQFGVLCAGARGQGV